MPDMRILPPAARFILQGGEVARTTASDAFRLALPGTPCCANAADGRAALWLGPEEYLLLAPSGDARTIAAALATALAGIPHSLVDVSQRQIALRISGPDASAILNSGCPLDLDPSAFAAGACTRTIFHKAEIVVWRKAAEEYHLEIWRSFSNYVLGLLREHQGDDHAQRSSG